MRVMADGVTLHVAADLLGMGYEALKQRVRRAKKLKTSGGVRVDLGYEVWALKPPFSKEWTVFIPSSVVRAVTKGKKRRK